MLKRLFEKDEVWFAVVWIISVFAIEPSAEKQIIITVIQTVLGVGYGMWLLHMKGDIYD